MDKAIAAMLEDIAGVLAGRASELSGESFAVEDDEDGLRVRGTGRAVIQEYGTELHEPQPYVRQAVRETGRLMEARYGE